MNAHVHLIQHGDIVDFHECCIDYQWFYASGWIDLHTAVDNLQWLAERWGLIEEFGQDFIQQLIAYEHTFVPSPPTQYEIDYVQRIIAQWEKADAARPRPAPTKTTEQYRTPQSTIDAFFTVAQSQSAEYLARWLGQHPLDAPHLLKIWTEKCSPMTK